MSQTFFQKTITPFQGNLNTASISYLKPPTLYPSAIGVVVNWNNYPGLGTSVDMTTVATGGQAIDRITSVYIDNTKNGSSVYVQCPDTGYVVVAQGDTVGWYPLITNGRKVNLYCEAINQGTNLTSFFFANIYVQPFTDTQISKVYPQIQITDNPPQGLAVFNSIAAGDTTAGVTFGPGTGIITLLPIQTVGIYIITNMWVDAVRAYSINPTSTFVEFGQVTLLPGTSLMSWPYMSYSDRALIARSNIFNQSGMQLYLDATKAWGFCVASALDTGFFEGSMNVSWISQVLV